MTEYYTLGDWDKDGVPKYLDEIETLEPTIINRIFDVLPEKSNIPVNYPQFITDETTRNIIIQTDREDFAGADVYVSFVYEGAGYKNVVGYYVYDLHDDYIVPTKLVSGSWVPMTYSDRNAVDESKKSILKKTIIFPNASLPTWANSNGKNSMAGGGNLLPGSKVKLLYNIDKPEEKFPNNVGIGFFLIPNGWNGNTRTFSNVAERVYTDKVFNTKDSVQTILLFDSQTTTEENGTNMVIAFEDIMRPGGDADYNDVIIKVNCTPYYCVKGLDKSIILNDSEPITSDEIVLDRTGIYYQLKDTTVSNYNRSSSTVFKFKHIIHMDNHYEHYNTFKQVLINLTKSNDTYLEFEDEEGDDDHIRKIHINTDLPKNKLQNNIYIFSSFENIDKTSPINPNVSILVEFQNIYKFNSGDSIKKKEFCILNDSDEVLKNDDEYEPSYRNLSSPYAMGDPHITTIYGDKYDMPNDTLCYEMYNNKELIINAKLDHFYQNDSNPDYKDLTFLNYVSVIINNGEQNNHIIANMYHPGTYCVIENDNIVELKQEQLVDYPLFEFLDESDILSISKPRRDYYAEISNTNTFDLKYIKVKTFSLGVVYVELFFIPHRGDFVNSISIINPNLNSVTAKGALVYKKSLRTVDNLLSN
ncbi:protein of unknown function DUF4114 [Hokovirus HKV1]|uniref:DUF4114 domain-containing protein n=1 Tax=Hokovirus HKV1 TaxID=1977638 RepID=A0A1V0SGG5_9VIRU|nr:protein of unknown function DUF4114 [Hokovirus HKV1]